MLLAIHRHAIRCIDARNGPSPLSRDLYARSELLNGVLARRTGRLVAAVPSLDSIFHQPLRATVAGLWVAGVAIAGFAATRAWSRVGATRALPYLGVVAGGILLATAVHRRNRVGLALSTVALGGQILGVMGSAWQLARGVDASKARELRDLGFDPDFGVVLNLLYSTVASAVFAWIVARWLAGRRRPT